MIYLALEVGGTAPGITDRCAWRGLISQHSRSTQHQLSSLSNIAHQRCKMYSGFDTLKSQQCPSSVQRLERSMPVLSAMVGCGW
jgi:hypothetical protein